MNVEGRVRMAGLLWGPEAARPVLALHGWLDNAGTFTGLAPLLEEARILALDLPGHGLSEALPPRLAYHFLDLLEDIDAAAAAMSDAPVHLLGHSMGGALSMVYAAARPERVASVVSIDALGALTESAKGTPARLREALKARARGPGSGRRFSSREAAIKARCKDRRLSYASAERLAERGLTEEDTGWRWNADRRHYWPSISRYTEEQVLAVMGAIRAPVLLIQARDSQYRMPEEMLKRRFAAIPNAESVQLPGGHHLHLDDPGPCAEVINRFWLQVDAAAD